MAQQLFQLVGDAGRGVSCGLIQREVLWYQQAGNVESNFLNRLVGSDWWFETCFVVLKKKGIRRRPRPPPRSATPFLDDSGEAGVMSISCDPISLTPGSTKNRWTAAKVYGLVLLFASPV